MSPARFVSLVTMAGGLVVAVLAAARKRTEFRRYFEELSRMSPAQLAALELPQSSFMLSMYKS